jgi:hypothetical protein
VFPPDQITSIVPPRAAPVLAATEYVTVCPLRPFVKPVSVIHGVVVDTANEQPFCVFRVGTKLKLPPALDTLCADGVSVYVQVATPDCVTVSSVLVPDEDVTVMVPPLTIASGFALNEKAIAADAVPDALAVIVSHAALDDAVQLHPVPVTESAPVDCPASGGTVCVDAANA